MLTRTSIPAVIVGCALAGMSVDLPAQNVVTADLRGQPLVYLKGGKLSGCGIRVIIVDTPPKLTDATQVPVWDFSFNLYLPGTAAVKIGSYNVSANEIRSGKFEAKPKNVPTAMGWLKAPNSEATNPLNGVGKSEDAGFILYSTELDSVLALFKAQLDQSAVLVGTRREGAKMDRIFSGPIAMSETENAQIVQCLKEFLAASTK